MSNAETSKANQKFYDETAHEYEQINRMIFSKQNLKRLKNNIAYIKKVSGNDVIVDMGTGTGIMMRLANELGFKERIGVDISKEMLKIADAHCTKTIHASVDKVPLKANIADGVTCHSVLHHLKDFSLLLKEAHRILKKGGVLHTDNDPNVKYYDDFDKTFVGKQIRKFRPARYSVIDEEHPEYMVEYHRSHGYGIDADKVKKLLEKIGFTDIKISYRYDPNCVSNYLFKILDPFGKVKVYYPNFFIHATKK